MITVDYRPKTFSDMAGQSLAKMALKSIVENPEKAPKTLIFHGAFGTGKTTSARVFAHALNCSGSKKPCMKCESCLTPIEESPYYREYDSSVIGRVEKIRELRDTFYVNLAKGWQVIVFDEVHLVSAAAQGTLLKVLEEAPKGTFFVLCTTDPEKLLNTIRSRAFEIKFESVPVEDITDNLRVIVEKEGLEVEDDLLTLIAHKSKGHMRDAHKYLDQLELIGEEEFKKLMRSCVDDWFSYFEGIALGSKDQVIKSIKRILMFPLAESKDDFSDTVLAIAKQMVDYEKNEKAERIVKLLGSNTLKLVKLCVADWVLEGFKSDVELQTTLLCVYQMLSQSSEKKQAQKSIYDRAVRR